MIEISKHHYDTLVYWANRGYKHDGKAYREKYPDRKDPWYKINQGPLEKSVGYLYEKDLDIYTRRLSNYIKSMPKIKSGRKKKIKKKDIVYKEFKLHLKAIRNDLDFIQVNPGKTHE